jgi:hypothetical protein
MSTPKATLATPQSREEITAALATAEPGQLVLRRDGTFDTIESLDPDDTKYPVDGENGSYTAQGYYLADSDRDRDERSERIPYDEDIVAVVPTGAALLLDFAVPTPLKPGNQVRLKGWRDAYMTVESVVVNRVTCTWFDTAEEPTTGPHTGVFLAETLELVS